MRRNIDGTCGNSCRNPNIRTINTMDADTVGNFEIRAGNSVSITTETNGIRIAYTGGITTYDNTDGNIVIDNDLFTINLADDLAITGNVSMGGDLGVTGDAVIAGDLTVNGTFYTVHAEHVYTQDDYIIMRDGAVTGLGSGDFSGFQVKLYDGVNDGRLVIDNSGTARVGDVGDEQPLLTREESADLDNGDILTWDANDNKAKGIPITDLAMTKIPVARCWAISNNVPQSTVTDMIFSSGTTNDNDVFSVNNGVITTKKTGMYLIICSISGSVTSSTRVELTFKRDSTGEYYYSIQEITITGSNQGLQAMFIVNETTSNHTYQMQIWSSGSALTTSNAGTGSFFNVMYLG